MAIPLTIQAGDFKSKCLQLMDEVNDKHVSYIITKHGRPVAKMVPIHDEPFELFGSLMGTLTIQKDITKPISVEWEENE